MSGVIKTQFDQGSIAIADGTTPTALSCTVQFDQADLSVSQISPNLRDQAAYSTRGRLRSLRMTDRVYPSGSLSLMMTEFTDGTNGNVLDMLHGTSGTPYASRVSTTTAKGDLMTFDIVITIEGTDLGDSADHTITLEDCHIVPDFAHGDPNTITLNFTMYGAVSGDLSISEG